MQLAAGQKKRSILTPAPRSQGPARRPLGISLLMSFGLRYVILTYCTVYLFYPKPTNKQNCNVSNHYVHQIASPMRMDATIPGGQHLIDELWNLPLRVMMALPAHSAARLFTRLRITTSNIFFWEMMYMKAVCVFRRLPTLQLWLMESRNRGASEKSPSMCANYRNSPDFVQIYLQRYFFRACLISFQLCFYMLHTFFD